MEMSPQWATGLEAVLDGIHVHIVTDPSLESLCSSTGATQNSKGRHLVSVRWSDNTLCMCVFVIMSVRTPIERILYIDYLFLLQTDVQPLNCALRR